MNQTQPPAAKGRAIDEVERLLPWPALYPRPAACAGDVCRRRGGAAGHRRQPGAARIKSPISSVRISSAAASSPCCSALASPLRRHPPAGHHVGHLRRRHAHAGHRRQPGAGADRHLRRHHRRRHPLHPAGAPHLPLDAALSHRGDRGGHHLHRHQHHAGGHRLDGGGKGNPEYGSLRYIGTSFLVLAFILLVTRFTKGFFSNISVLLGILFGFGVAIAMGK